MKRPAFQFYPGDWLEEIGLRAVGLDARGLWVDMLCFMHQGEPYGHLRKGGRDITPQELARMVGAGRTLVARLLSALEERHVFSRTDEGTIFSRRMVRDEKLRAVRAEGGEQGGPKGGAKAFENPRASRPGDARKGGRKPAEEPPIQPPLVPPIEPPPSSPSPSPSPSPDNGQRPSAEPSAGGVIPRSRETWLTPYGLAWEERWGAESEPPFGEMAKEFARGKAQALRQKDPEDFLERWRRFLAAGQTSQWARPSRFVQGLGEWAEGAALQAPVKGGGTAGDRTMAAAARFIARGKP